MINNMCPCAIPDLRAIKQRPDKRTPTKVFVFDTIPYDHHFEEFKAYRFIPYPLPRQYFDLEVAARNYAGRLEVAHQVTRVPMAAAQL